MISITSAQLDLWINALIFPMARILGFVGSAPLWNSAGISRRVRLMLGIALTLGLMPILPEMPRLPPGSGAGMWVLSQQVLIGMAMGFAARVVFSAVDLAGAYISMQMGLGFATLYDPQNTAQTPVLSSFLTLLTLLVFLSMNGHLVYVGILARSFEVIPVGVNVLGPDSWLNLAKLGSQIFSFGLLLALPVLVALMITNLTLGILTRAAPQLNVFSIGFPITLTAGFLTLLFGLQYLTVPLERLFTTAAEAMLGFVVLNPAR